MSRLNLTFAQCRKYLPYLFRSKIFHGCTRVCSAAYTSTLSEKLPQMTLLKHLQARIRFSGALTVADYMREVLTNPVSGYYMTRDMFGAKGDFTTSPEISQMFGELVAVWCAHEWAQIEVPELQIVELGPGRGTLTDDMLRVLAKLADCAGKLSVHLVEVSPTLSRMQAEKLAAHHDDIVCPAPGSECTHTQHCISRCGVPVFWYRRLADVPRQPSFVVAHELFDALPVHVFQKGDSGAWHEVLVDAGEGDSLRFVKSARPTPASLLLRDAISPGDPRTHIELCLEGGVLVQEMADRVRADGGFALVVDYGHEGEKSDTLRGFKAHRVTDPLEDPGECDLTADVDFAYLARMVATRCAVHGPIPQSSWLVNMGIGYRLKALLAAANEKQRRDHVAAAHKLCSDSEMGERFKFLALTQHRDGHVPAGFTPLES